jgi:hypothetical protein
MTGGPSKPRGPRGTVRDGKFVRGRGFTSRQEALAGMRAMPCSRWQATAFLSMLPGRGAVEPDAGGDARGRAFGGDILGDGGRGEENDEARSTRGAAAMVGFAVSWPLALRVGCAHERVRGRD